VKLVPARAHIAVLLLVPALAVSACGGGGNSTSSSKAPTAPSSTAPGAPGVTPGGTPNNTTGPTATTAPPAVVNAFKDCMTKHGIKMPPPGQSFSPPPGYDPKKAQLAFAACMKSMAPSASPK